jgi:hypothetical protein
VSVTEGSFPPFGLVGLIDVANVEGTRFPRFVAVVLVGDNSIDSNTGGFSWKTAVAVCWEEGSSDVPGRAMTTNGSGCTVCGC